MRNKFFILPLFFFPPLLYCQNLIPNYSFEEYISCPDASYQIYMAENWFQPCIFNGNIVNSSFVTYLNSCATNNSLKVPKNDAGYQNAVTGNAYSGLHLYYFSAGFPGEFRGYLEVELSDTLEKDKKYFAEFYISLADSSNWAAADIGVYFSNDSLLDSSRWNPLQVIPQINNFSGNLLADTSSWMKISGTYIASGSEKFVTIGNFKNDHDTYKKFVYDVGMPNSRSAYYYIDDVSVSLANCTDSCIRPSAKYSYEANELTAEFNNMSSAEATHWFWNFGDGNMDTAKNPVHVYDSSGTYSITFIACYRGGCYNSEWCCDTITGLAAVNGVGVKDFRIQDLGFRIYPNPNDGKMQLDYKLSKGVRGELVIFDLTGRMVKRLILNNEHSILQLDAPELTEGMYLYNVLVGDEVIISDKLVIIK